MHPGEMSQILGKLVVFEGIDSSGKSSIISILPRLLGGCQVPIITTGERRSPLAKILSGEALRTYSPFLKTYLFAADRAWTYDRECLPALRSGSLVLWDRYVDSAIAYRSVELRHHESRIDLEFVRHLNSPFMRPDLTLYIDVASETSLSRSVHNRKIELYNFDFLKQVRLEYLTLAAEQGYVIVDGERPLQIVAEEAASIIRDRLTEMFK